MADIFTAEQMSKRLDELQVTEKKKETQVDQFEKRLTNACSKEDELKIIDAMTALNKVIESIKQERMSIMELMKIQIEKGVVTSPSKKMRRSLPSPTSGCNWNFGILEAYSINFQLVYTLNELLFQTAPTTSDRAIRFADACSIISLENLLKDKFPSDSQASWLAKHLYLTTIRCFGNMEASIDDMVIVLFNALGFNDGDLITVSRNRLKFQMSKKPVCADADLTVFNLKTMIRLALVEDKKVDATMGIDESGEPQLVAEAIAAAMYNQKLIAQNDPRRAISEPPTNDPNAREFQMINTSCISDLIIFMIRVSGFDVYFYSHKFSDALLDSIANGVEPMEHTQIKKFTVIENNKKRHGLSLLIADDRALIFQVLDSIQQIISKTGFEYVQLVNDYDTRIRINGVVEFFNRTSLRFIWPSNN
ncbi:unnamed protein product [Rotaria magnacalcarata]|uniref:Uncharacterized protein n=3 Tax=Rotaria magnacalcarata TaxID=392030 RepID=A0A816T1G7_9BILA|nr:unnamed protein product [Rotaria magnacalcarata]CAF1975791.1 unnamed protein product [Rotaria magnacalcarata]CAF2091998.1 unnamed protein product [Rotaria magnacalcarata]CAF2231107.1 unnamed protein product [Rotaria magnacalcarata]CAF3798491.1 unnamed protein product [Rotaria magnacalcarata]